jgi:hypothetical protein
VVAGDGGGFGRRRRFFHGESPGPVTFTCPTKRDYADAMLVAPLRALEQATRPMSPELEEALSRRWASLPERVRTPAQALGRRTVGCEGTHGVFPRCDLACTPCYHSREANRVRVDGAHTVESVDRQMALLRSVRGPGQHAQLIGGEVTLLSPDDHASALMVMRRHGRKPMSMSHGDFDYEYLRSLVLGRDGAPRLPFVSFAGHFDSLMLGRRGIRRPPSEASLNEYRERFCAMFQRLERETGVRHYLAHNMTVTPANVGEVASVVRDCRDMGFRMFSFQPAAYIGNPNRWKGGAYRSLSSDDVWAEIERGIGARLPFGAFQFGDARCNRTAYGALVGSSSRWVPFLDDRSSVDMQIRDEFFRTLGGMDFEAPLVVPRLLRALAARPVSVPLALRFAARFARRAGGVRAARSARALTFVMHSFMDASLVTPAWQALRRGERLDDPDLRATQERLEACMYHMAHPRSGELVPACAQHSVLDPAENMELARQLPMAR